MGRWHVNYKDSGFNFSETDVADGRLFLQNGGNVGVNTNNPTEQLDIDGNMRIRSVASGAFKYALSLANNGVLTTSTSDRRLKENISNIRQPLEKILSLRGVTYNWKSDETKELRIGLIAQEVEEIVPELVFTNELDGYKGVHYQEVVALLIEAIKEQHLEIEIQHKKMNLMEKQLLEMQSLKREMATLKQMLQTNTQ